MQAETACIVMAKLLSETVNRFSDDHVTGQLDASVARRELETGIQAIARTAAHDFNNILSAMSLTLELMQGDNSEIELKQNLDNMEQLLLRGRQKARFFETRTLCERYEPQPVDLKMCLQNAVGLAKRHHPIEISCDLPGEAVFVHTDPMLLTQVIRNLIRNGVEASPLGPELRVSLKPFDPENAIVFVETECICRTRFEYGKKSPDWIVEVSDRGGGMDAAVLDAAMKPFFSTKSTSDHFGIGLCPFDHLMRAGQVNGEIVSITDSGTIVRLEFSSIQI